MKVLVIGSGGREHAIVDALYRSNRVERLFCAPGNAGIAAQATCVPIGDTDIPALLDFARQEQIDLTVVGPEAALAKGLVDSFRAAGLTVFGHTAAATRIESSKAFAKRLMADYSIPTAAYRVFTDYQEALDYVRQGSLPAVIKYDGLAAGKGVVIAHDMTTAQQALQDMLLDGRYGEGRVVIEDYLEGPEFSFMCLVRGEEVFPLPLAQDHKRAYDGDEGPNTGGMGAYTPLPFITKEDYDFALHRIMEPVARAMVKEGTPLTGILYGGLMKTQTGIKVIEFNARFGDPETEVILPLLLTDAASLFHAVATDEPVPALRWDNQAVIGVVLASKGYPGHYAKGFPITGADSFPGLVYHMGTRTENGQLLTAGGRVLMAIVKSTDLLQARETLYRNLPGIQCDNLFYRNDIAVQAL